MNKDNIKSTLSALSELEEKVTGVEQKIDKIDLFLGKAIKETENLTMEDISCVDLQELIERKRSVQKIFIKMLEEMQQKLLETMTVAEIMLDELDDKRLSTIIYMRVIDKYRWNQIERLLGSTAKQEFELFMNGD